MVPVCTKTLLVGSTLQKLNFRTTWLQASMQVQTDTRVHGDTRVQGGTKQNNQSSGANWYQGAM